MSVVTSTVLEKAQYIIDNLAKLGNSQGFAKSLASKALLLPNNLSQKQLEWLDKLAGWAENGKPEPVKISLGNFKSIYEMFKKAKNHLKYPKVKLLTKSGNPVFLYMSGNSSHVPGVINVSNGKKYGHPDNKWYGRVFEDGEYQKSGSVHDPEVDELLQSLANSPVEVAHFYGKQTSQCCFCSKELTDSKSVAVGYGPICAYHFGLPWGDLSHSEVKAILLDETDKQLSALEKEVESTELSNWKVKATLLDELVGKIKKNKKAVVNVVVTDPAPVKVLDDCKVVEVDTAVKPSKPRILF
jgi:hypothetical protein